MKNNQERNICSLYYCNALCHGANASVMYREPSVMQGLMYYEVILWERDGKERGNIIMSDDLHCIDDKEAFEKASKLLLDFII